MTLAAVPTSPPAPTFDSVDPSTGSLVATFPVHSAQDVNAAVGRARTAFSWWDGLGHDGRRRRLKAWNAHLTRHLGELADLMHEENGKPVADAVLELTLAVEHLGWAAENAERVLGARRVPSGLLAANQEATLAYPALGVVGVIGPWNYPVFTPMGSIAYALAAGNAVVFKPSEHTPAIGSWLVDSFHEVIPEEPVLQLVTGLGETGAALCRSGVDKLAFTGSTATGKKVMAACAENLVPVLMECGGKDAMIVCDDADIPAAADAALWGAMSNGGQTCIGIERVYATAAVYDRFVEELTAKARAVHPGSDRGASYGPATMPSQLTVIRDHITDAIARGGRAVLGGSSSVGAVSAEPVILVDVPETSTAVTDETFGPTLTVTRVATAQDALDLTNAGQYGLGGSVFTKSRSLGMQLAHGMRSGMTSINSVLAFAFVPSLPFGGVGQSGFGRIHGEDGLKEFTRAKAITRQRFALPVPLTSFDRPAVVTRLVPRLLRLLHR
jgi:acyl-CoA reductase-like NAD-dependent aldehyde dehydrogenase